MASFSLHGDLSSFFFGLAFSIFELYFATGELSSFFLSVNVAVFIVQCSPRERQCNDIYGRRGRKSVSELKLATISGEPKVRRELYAGDY